MKAVILFEGKMDRGIIGRIPSEMDFVLCELNEYLELGGIKEGDHLYILIDDRKTAERFRELIVSLKDTATLVIGKKNLETLRKMLLAEGFSVEKKILVKKERERPEKKAVVARRKKVINVVCNNDFALMLAHSISGAGRVALVEIDRLSPVTESRLSLKGEVSFRSILEGSHLLNETEEFGEFDVIPAFPMLEAYESYSEKDFMVMHQMLSDKYDYLIYSSNFFIYDSFSVLALLKSDVSVFPLKARFGEIISLNRKIRFLETRQRLSKESCMFVSFDHSNDNLSEYATYNLLDIEYAGNLKRSRQLADLLGGRVVKERQLQRMKGKMQPIVRKLGLEV